MNSLTFLYTALGISALFITVCIGYVSVYVVESLKEFRRVLRNIDTISTDVKDMEQTVKNSIFGTIGRILRNVSARHD